MRKLGSFEVLREIGQGGMGIVYLACQPALERLAVLKRIRRELVADSRMLERFQREARAAGSVHHQNVVAVYDCFSVRGDHFIAQEYVDGPDLSTILADAGHLPPDLAALIGLEVIRGLEVIHASGTIHRDLKPANILLGCDGSVKIADFGIALDGRFNGLTQPGMMIGSVPYMSPEQMTGKRVDYRSDLFSFGLLLYEMLVGAPPFIAPDDESVDVVLDRIRKGRFAPPRRCDRRIPRGLSRLIERCLQAKPARRPASSAAVRRTLERYLGPVAWADSTAGVAAFLGSRGVVSSTGDRTEIRAQPAVDATWSRRRNPLPAVIGAIPLVLAATYFVGWMSHKGAPDPPTAPVRVFRPAAPPAERQPESMPATSIAPPSRTSVAAVTSPPPVTPAPEPARVRFVAHPWARVRVDEDERGFHTPRAEPSTLEAGRHLVVFEHPTFGSRTYEIVLAPGETRIVRHVFDGAPRP